MIDQHTGRTVADDKLGRVSGGEFNLVIQIASNNTLELNSLSGTVEIAVGKDECASFPAVKMVPVDIDWETPERYGIEGIVERNDVAVASPGSRAGDGRLHCEVCEQSR